MVSATAAATASPQTSPTQCSARSMPAVTPALDHTGPSTTNTRLAHTCARGARVASVSRCSWWVVTWRRPSRPASAASSVPTQMVNRRCEGWPGDVARAIAGPTTRVSQWRAPSHPLRCRCGSVSRSPGRPGSTTQAPGGSASGNGSRFASCKPIDVDASGCAPT